MNLQIKGHKILVKPEVVKEEEVSAGGIVIPKKSETVKMERRGVEKGEVLAVGNTCWKGDNYNSNDPAWEPWCKVGDKIFFSRYSGKSLFDGDVEYLILNDDDIQCVIKD